MPLLTVPIVVRRVAVDPGHGGTELGATGPATHLAEKTVVLDISRQVVAEIRKRLKVEAFLTRDRDRTLPLDRRAALIRKRRADILLSIHCNANTVRSLRGVSTYYLNVDHRRYASRLMAQDPLVARENRGISAARFNDLSFILSDLAARSNERISRVLAAAIQRSLVRRMRLRYRKVRDIGSRRALFYLLLAARVPGVLVETSFITNPLEEARLASRTYRKTVAKGIVDGLERFFLAAKAARRTARRR